MCRKTTLNKTRLQDKTTQNKSYIYVCSGFPEQGIENLFILYNSISNSGITVS